MNFVPIASANALLYVTVRPESAKVFRKIGFLFLIQEETSRFVDIMQQGQSPRFYCFLLLSTGAKLFASKYLWRVTHWP
jgi:hypothetical protein